MSDFQARNALVFGVSPDDEASHRRFIEKFNLEVRLLSDPEHRFMEAVGAWGEKVLYGRTSIGPKRCTIIVSPDGKVAKVWKAVSPAGHAAKVLVALEKLATK